MRRLLFILLLAATGCDAYEPAGVEQQYVVEAYLQAGEPMPQVRLSRTAAVGATYTFEDFAVSDAEVRIERVDTEEPVTLYAESDEDGVYDSYVLFDGDVAGAAGSVAPGGHYRLEITPPSGDGIDVETITAETVVPDTFRIVETSGDALVWRDDPLFVTLTRSRYPGRGARYVVSTVAREPTRENLTPLARQALERAGEDFDLNTLSVTESPVINEGNYEIGPDSTLTIDIPWLVANFYGPNEIAVRALGENYYDFLRSQQVQQGGSTFSPGEIPNIIERVAGGTGLFGSYAEVQYQVDVRRAGE